MEPNEGKPSVRAPPVYINGFASRGPGFKDSNELFEKLLRKEEMACETIAGKDRFDCDFFQHSSNKTTYTDPQIRFLLELTYEALVESGVINFEELPKAEVGVYVGSSFGDFHQATLKDKNVDGHVHVGAAGAMLANSISRFFQFGGVSMKIDSACSSSLQALDNACCDLRAKRTKIAVVAGSNMIIDPKITAVYEKMHLVSPGRGACKTFCSSADGYVRQEAVVVMVLSSEKELQAKGCSYVAEIIGHKSRTGSESSITTPCQLTQENLYRDVARMAETRVDGSSKIHYVECHGTGTKMGDEAEIAVLRKVVLSEDISIYSNTAHPLPIGSIKSNIGHTEGASGLMSLVKVLLSLERGVIPPNLHYTDEDRNQNCLGLGDGTLRVITEKEPLDSNSIAVVNSFGFGGTCTQVIVRGARTANRSNDRKTEPWMNINPVVGRTVATTLKLSETLSKKKLKFSSAVGPPDIHKGEFSVRSFTTPEGKKTYTEGVNPNISKPIWLVFAGNGSVQPLMGYDLYIRSKVYKSVFTRCSEHLVTKWKCDSLNRLVNWQHGMSKEPTPFKNIVDATVCLVAVQICLINLLKVVGITSDSCKGYIGHSAGEIVAGYFDGCYTLETTLDIAVIRGKVAASVATQHKGAMYVVLGLSRKSVEDLIQHMGCSVDIACHTGKHQVTLSGLESELIQMVDELKEKHPNALMRKINTFGVPFHSKLIDPSILKELRKQLDTELKGVKPQSNKWILCGEQGDLSGTSGQYHCQGFRNCVEFYRASQKIPERDLIIECGPTEVFRSVFVTEDQTNNDDTRYISLLRGEDNAVETFATAYGHLFLQMIPLSENINTRHSPKEFFCSPTQRSIREVFFTWDHSKSFSNFLQPNCREEYASKESLTLNFDLNGADKWLRQHIVGGCCLLPASVYLYATWQGIQLNSHHECILQDFQIHQPVDISNFSEVQLFVEFINSDGDFMNAIVHWTSIKVASCKVILQNITQLEVGNLKLPMCKKNDNTGTKSIYNQLGRHGYSYGKDFRAITAISPNKMYGRIEPYQTSDTDVGSEAKACIIAFDAMLQHIILKKIGDKQYGPCQLPVYIKKIHLKASPPQPISNKDNFNSCLDATTVMFCITNAIAEISGVQMKTKNAPDAQLMRIKLDNNKIIPVLSNKFDDPKSVMNVHYFPGDVDPDSWKRQLLELRNTVDLCILVSDATGFASFIYSLQKEPGYKNIRGLQALNVDTINNIPIDLIRKGYMHFLQHHAVCCLFICDQGDVGLNKLNLMSEEMQLLSDPKQVCHYGCSLTLTGEQPENFDCWIAHSSLSSNSINNCSKVPTCKIAVEYASINFRDVMIAIGKIPRKSIVGYGSSGSGLGLDFAGFRQVGLKNKKVIGLGRDCITDTLQAQPNYLCWELSDDKDLKEYATVPCVYATAYYALYMRGGLKENSKVLVHCGAGGVGQAALRLCKNRLTNPGLQLFVTCGNQEKKKFLHKEFEIPMENIGDSRSRSFVMLIKEHTNGEGVNMVLNSLSGKLMEASIECLSFGGKLLELGKSKTSLLVMDHLRQGDKQICMIDLDQLMSCQKAFEPIKKNIELGLQNGEVVPISHRQFVAPRDIKEAFEFMLKGEHIGKVLLKMSSNICCTVPNIAATLHTSSPPRKQVIIIVGGLGGFGLCLAELFAKRWKSVCKLVLCSRSGIIRQEQERAIRNLRQSYMADVNVWVGDCSQREKVDNLLYSLNEDEELRVIINAAASIKDVVFDQMDTTSWLVPFNAKVTVTSNLLNALDDLHFSKVSASLQHFICISSVVAAIGNTGQSNYSCANAAMEKIILDRVANGKVGLCVRLALMPHVGLGLGIVRDPTLLRPVNIDHVLKAFEKLIASTTKGVYAIYGFSEDNRKFSKIKCSAYCILQVLQRHAKNSMDDATINTRINEFIFESLDVIFVLKELREVTGKMDLTIADILKHSPLELSELDTSPTLKGNAPSSFQLTDDAHTISTQIIVIANIDSSSKHIDRKKHRDEIFRGLSSIREQTCKPFLVFIIFEDKNDFIEETFVKEILSVLPDAKLGENSRTEHSSLGSMNSGIMISFDETSIEKKCWIAFIDTATTLWCPDHLERCMMTVNTLGATCQLVTSPSDGLPREQMPGVGDSEFFAPPVIRCGFFVRRTLMMEAGLFDETMGCMAAADLYVRLNDVLAGEEGELPGKRQASTGICTTETQHLTTKATYGVPNKIIKSLEEDDSICVKLYLYKHGPRIAPTQINALKNRLCHAGYDIQKEVHVSQIASFPECQHVALKLWGGENVLIRQDTYDALCDSDGDASIYDVTCSPQPPRKMIVGIITSDVDRVCGLLRDLGCMLNDPMHCVVLFANKHGSGLENKLSTMLQDHKFRSHVINEKDQIVHEVCEAIDSDPTMLPLSIAEARTVIQTFLLATIKEEEFDLMAVLDDDMRLPKGWGVRDGDENIGDILLSRVIKTPPNPTVMSMRTQLLDFLYALDSQHPQSQDELLKSSQCPAYQYIYKKNLADQYYDLSSTRWDHLEIPRRFVCSIKRDEFVEYCKHRILVGDPLAREAVSMEEGQSLQRGGCMVLYKNSFFLLGIAQEAPTVKLASGRKVASRRSDSFWVQNHSRSNGKRSVVRKNLAILHENIHDKIPLPQRMRESVALEMIGAILCRPIEERKTFALCRVNALCCSIARIQGICKTLRGRPYFKTMPKLSKFVKNLEELFCHDLWQQEVYNVIAQATTKLSKWVAHEQPKHEFLKRYTLKQSESSFLYNTNTEPTSILTSGLHQGASLPIPCLHRFYRNGETLRGAHKVQESIGMSLDLSSAEKRLKQLSRLSDITEKRALVTIDDGFRDVMLLQGIFRSLSKHLQPILFVPSALLRENDDLIYKRHLPLTCLYEYCAIRGIGPDDSILGDACRRKLKALPEKTQYQRLKDHDIPVELNTDDLLSLSDLNTLAAEGWWIGTHGSDHSDLTTATSCNEFFENLKEDCMLIRSRGWVPWFAWPEGRWCARLADTLALQSGGPTEQFGLSTPPLGEGQHPAVVNRVIWNGKQEKRERILVTGANGFLGKHLFLLLQGYGFDVFQYDIADGNDILNKDALLKELRNKEITSCVHLAAISDLNKADEDPEKAQQVNVCGTKNVLSCCDECGVRMLFASTCCIYGNNGIVGANNELSPVAPTEIYARTKLEGEKIVLSSPRFGELHHVIMRLATFYGPGMRGALATALFLEAICKGNNIEIHGSGRQTRCYTHVHDIANGIRVILQTTFSGIINVSDNQECSVNELVEICMKVIGHTVKIQHIKDRDGQIMHSMISNDRLRALGNRGWKPTISLEAGLQTCARALLKTLTLSGVTISAKKCTTQENTDKFLSRDVVSTKLPLNSECNGDIHVSEPLSDGTQLVGYIAGNLQSNAEIPVRIHSECLFGDMFGSLKCDCGLQFKDFMTSIDDNNPGILVYIKGHEGRGSDLFTKTKAYRDLDNNPLKHHNQALLDAGAKCVDVRKYDKTAHFLLRLVIEEFKKKQRFRAQGKLIKIVFVLHTNNKKKMKALERAILQYHTESFHFTCRQFQIPAKDHCTPLNAKYLYEKTKDNYQTGLGVTSVKNNLKFSSSQDIDANISLPQSIDELPGTTTRINNNVFDVMDKTIFKFMQKFGFAVVRDLVPVEKIKAGNACFDGIMMNQFKNVSQIVGPDQVTFNDFSHISQFRDIFLDNVEDNVFKGLTLDNTSRSLGVMAQKMMSVVDPDGGWDGIKLLHDHIITKPPGHASKKIPLHQDCMFWPVDIPACSTWTLLTDAPLDGGCMEIMEVANKPHQHQQNSMPVDFMADEVHNGLAMVINDDPKPTRWLIPMKKGETLLFTSHNWHRSSRNATLLSRVAYIQTWVHPKARWRPDLVPWHPVNEYLHKEGLKTEGIISGDRHPTIIPLMGQSEDNLTIPNNNCHPKGNYVRHGCGDTNAATKQDVNSISMFDASDVISTQIYNILALRVSGEQSFKGKKPSLVKILSDTSCCEQLVNITIQKVISKSASQCPSKISTVDLKQSTRCKTFADLLKRILKQVLISTVAYQYHRSRNVFNSAYSAWWSQAGETWNTHFLDGSFESMYRLCKTDVTCFLKRISVLSSSEECQLKLLEAIIRGCMEHIPFQNITMLTRVNKSGHRCHPTLGEIIKDMLTGVGGLCTVRNPFLFLLLNAMGFNDVRFVSGTMCPPGGKELKCAHIALLVKLDCKDYWVDIANGFPYLSPIPLNSDKIIEHPFCNTRIIRCKKNNRDVYMVQHQFILEHPVDSVVINEWTDNYYFEAIPVEYKVGFAFMHKMHYDGDGDFGPFLKNFRFNLWSADGGIYVRNKEAKLVSKIFPLTLHEPDMDLWDSSGESSQLAIWIHRHGFKIHDCLVHLIPEAWARCQENSGNIRKGESVIVTGGFFDETADAYIGSITVWREREKQNVVGLTFRTIQTYSPNIIPVINKGFTGGSWHNDELYVCWPNRIAVLSPASDWSIKRHIDNPQFNDLHHVHACNKGLWVANTGLDTIDHLTLDGKLNSRVCIASNSNDNSSECEDDIRDQVSHTARRGSDKEHVNYVDVVDMALLNQQHDDTSEQRPLATLLQPKRVICLPSLCDDNKEESLNVVLKLPPTSPPHEGFLERSLHVSNKYLVWNSTVDGLVFASDPQSGEIIKCWKLSDYGNKLPRGWTRGLCLLQDGILVGSTCIRGSAESWIKKKHDSEWNFKAKESRTAVSFIPFHNNTTTNNTATKCVEVLNNRSAKIYSLLHTPSTL